MSLSLALDNAKAALSATTAQTTVVSRNVSNAQQNGFTRKSANAVTTDNGGVRIASISRAFNNPLYLEMLANTSAAAKQDATVTALGRLQQTVGDTNSTSSLSARLNAVKTALAQYAAKPNDQSLGAAAVRSANDMAQALNTASSTIQETREQADKDMGDTVDTVNDLLQQLQTINDTIVKGSNTGADITDSLDTRDQILSKLSENIGIRIVPGASNSVTVFTDSGVTLFDKSPRTVSFAPISAYNASTTGNAVYVDGVAVTGASSPMPLTSGKLAGLAAVRDTIAVTYQNQVDEIARGLVETFSEQDQSGSGKPAVAGLFTWSGGPSVPASGSLSVGLAASLRVAAAVDPDQGGNVTLLRDGNISGAGSAYVYNSAAAAGYSDRLQALVQNISTKRSFSTSATTLATNTSLADFASSSIAWLEGTRKSATSEQTVASTALTKTSDALSNETGVNIDDEMAKMLDLERSYGAASKLLAAVDTMMKTLLEVV